MRHAISIRRRVLLVLLATLAFVTAACSSSDSANNSSSADDTAGSTPGSTITSLADPSPPPPAQAAGTATLAALGIGVYAGAGQSAPIDSVADGAALSPIRLLDTQAQAMMLEGGDGQGLLGATVDNVIGVDPGMPPPSFLVAGWITGSTSKRATYAHTLMGDRNWRNATAVVFPSLVLALYAADTAEFASSLAGPNASTDSTPMPTTDPVAPTSTPAPTEPHGFRRVDQSRLTSSRPLVVGLCSQVQSFIDGTIAALFDAIGHLAQPEPPASNGLFGSFIAGITTGYGLAVGVVNGLIDVAHFLTQRLIGLVTQPVLGYIARIAGVLGTVSLVVSFLRPWAIRMDDAPASTRKAIGLEPGLPGAVTATVDLGGYDEWPIEIADCALNAGVAILPPLKPVGAPIVWTMTQPDALAVSDTGVRTVLDANGSAIYRYATTQESVETSKGDLTSGILTIHAAIRRPAVADAQQTIADLVFDQVPGLIRPILQPLLLPAVTSVLAKIATVLDSTADTHVTVDFHSPPTTTTTSSPATTTSAAASTPMDPCSLVTAHDAAEAMGSDLGAGVSTPEPWGGQCNIDDGTILLNVLTGPAYKGGKAGYDAYLAGAQQGKANDTTGQSVLDVVTGIGEGAFVNGGGSIAGCVFYIGATTVTITVATGGATGPPPIGQVTAIAKTAAGHLGG